jgi:TolB-like protein/class 3 adenylate cyclase
MERRLSAILAVDVVGYSRLMEKDEADTFERLRAHRKDLFEPEIAAHHGRIFKLTGDGLLAEFGSVVDAVECAVLLQRQMAERNNGLADGQRIDVRMGINLGDVIIEDDDRHGEGVVIAARLQQLAEPGGIAVSGTVADHVKHKLALCFEPRGEERLKNIAEPVQVFGIFADASRPQRSRWFHTSSMRSHRFAAMAVAILLLLTAGTFAAYHWWPSEIAPPPDFPSIAVLPFNNFSGDPAKEYLSDGITEEIITTLSRFPDLAVIARNSTFVYKGQAADVRKVGKDLGVQYVLEGSVRNEGEKLRIIAQLIDTRTNEHVWADRYEESGSDPWVLLDEITNKIVTSLTGERGQLRRKEYEQAWGKDRGSLEEYDYYLRGHDIFINADNREEYNRSGVIWHEGLEKFPDSALLRIKLGFFYYMRPYGLWSDDPAEDYRRAGEFARAGFAGQYLSPQVRRLGHWLMAFVLAQEADYDGAIAEADMAIKLAPYDAFMLSNLSAISIMAVRPEQAIAQIKEAMVRDPQNREVNNFRLSWAYNVMGDYENSVAAAKDGPPWVDVPLLLAMAYIHLGRDADAKAQIKRALSIEPGFTQATWKQGYFYKDPSILERQLADLGKAGLPEK